MIYFIDFDSTICPGEINTPPQVECLEVLNRLKECNNQIFIYSCRANSQCVYDVDSSVNEMVDYLKKHNVPFDGVVPNKPFFNYYIDDRNVGTPLNLDGSVDWSEIKKLLLKNNTI